MPRDKNKLSSDVIRKIINSADCKVHFIGIGGVSMYTLARVTHSRGITVVGSDRLENERTRNLVNRGIPVKIGHDGLNSIGATLVVYSHAIGENNPELKYARNLNIPTVNRAEFMGALMLDYKKRIGVSGTHGKSTTTAMLDLIFTSALGEPTTLSGAELYTGEPIREGGNNLLIYEACEYRDSFLNFSPSIALATNLEFDHPDYFENIEVLKNSFRRALSRATDFALVNLDDENLSKIIPDLKTRVVTFGQSERAQYRYLITGFLDTGTEFMVYHNKISVGKFRLNVPGIHNVQNAAAAISLALEYGIDVKTVAAAIESFRTVSGRLDLIGYRNGRAVYMDYAHHPTEIRATINTLKLVTGDMLTVVFKPHTYSRTAALWEDFSSALSLADHIILTDIYPAREEPIKNINSRRLAGDIGERAIFSNDRDVAFCVDNYTSGTVVIMGAGDMEQIKKEIV